MNYKNCSYNCAKDLELEGNWRENNKKKHNTCILEDKNIEQVSMENLAPLNVHIIVIMCIVISFLFSHNYLITYNFFKKN